MQAPEVIDLDRICLSARQIWGHPVKLATIMYPDNQICTYTATDPPKMACKELRLIELSRHLFTSILLAYKTLQHHTRSTIEDMRALTAGC